MPSRTKLAALAGLWLALAVVPAWSTDIDEPGEPAAAQEPAAPGYSRELVIRYRLDAAARPAVSYREVFTVTGPAGVAELREVEIARRLLGGAPDHVRVSIRSADGGRQRAFEPRLQPAVARPRITLRDLAVGDRIEIEAARQAPPGAFPAAALRAFPRQRHVSQARVELSAPAALPIHHEARGFDVQESVEAGERRLVWTLQAARRGLTHVPQPGDPAPRVVFSTFPSFRALGDALAARLPVPPDEADVLAAAASRAVAAGGDVEPARAIFDWLVKAIAIERYAAEEEPLIFRTPAQVLAAGSGNHVEVANLYRRLLEARGIPAETLLTNRRRVFGLPRIGVPFFNATLVYLPAGDIYADPAGGTFTRGHVHPVFANKFALAPGAAEPERRMPQPAPETSGIRTFGEIAIYENGDVEGRSRVVGYGAGAPLIDEIVRQLPTGDQARLSRTLLERQLLSGRARLARAGASGQATTDVDIDYRLTANRSRDGSIRVPLAGGPRLIRRPVAAFLAAIREDNRRPLPCASLAHREDLVFHLPATGMRYQAPENRLIESRHARYAVRYELTDLTLRVERMLEFRFAGTICPPEVVADIAEVVRFANFDQSRRITILGEDE